jgi:hypothetical protein
MSIIFKYKINPPSSVGLPVRIKMPCGAQILSVGAQGNDIFVWALVDRSGPEEHRNLLVCPTGQALPTRSIGKLLGRVDLLELGLIFHIFEAS